MFFNKKKLNHKNFLQHYHSEGGTIVDVRTSGEYRNGHLDKAKNVDWLGGKFGKTIEKWDKEKPYYLYCQSGMRSARATAYMRRQGFDKAYNVGSYFKLLTLDLSK